MRRTTWSTYIDTMLCMPSPTPEPFFRFGDIDPASLALGLVIGAASIALAITLHRLTGYRVKAELEILTRAGDTVGPASVEPYFKAHPLLGVITEQIIAVTIRNTRRSPVTVTNFYVENVKPVRQKLAQKLFLAKGFRTPWLPGQAMTQTKIPVKLSSYDSETLAYPIIGAEFSAAAWCLAHGASQAEGRGVVVLGKGKKIKTNKILLPRVTLDLSKLRANTDSTQEQPAPDNDSDEVPA